MVPGLHTVPSSKTRFACRAPDGHLVPTCTLADYSVSHRAFQIGRRRPNCPNPGSKRHPHPPRRIGVRAPAVSTGSVPRPGRAQLESTGHREDNQLGDAVGLGTGGLTPCSDTGPYPRIRSSEFRSVAITASQVTDNERRVREWIPKRAPPL